MNIKNCPFCGGVTCVRLCDTNEIDYLNELDVGWEKEPYYQVVCSMNEDSPIPENNWRQGCGSSGGFRATKEEAIELWNRRAE